MQLVPVDDDAHFDDLLTILDTNGKTSKMRKGLTRVVEEGYKIIFDDPTTCRETISHYPLSHNDTLSDIYRLSSTRKETCCIPQLSSDHAIALASEKCTRMIVTQVKICAISCPIFYTYQISYNVLLHVYRYQKTFVCKNSVCGNHLKQILTMDPYLPHQDLRENDDNIRYDENHSTKCQNCRADLEECVELRCQQVIQIAKGIIQSDKSFKQPIGLVFNKNYLNQYNLGDIIQVAGYPRWILDSFFLSKLTQNPLAVYIDIIHARKYSPVNVLQVHNEEYGAETIDFLLNEFCCRGQLDNLRWKRAGLVSLAAHASNSSGSPIDVCFITDEVLLLKHLLHRIGCKSLDMASEKFDTVRKKSSTFITGKNYSIRENGFISSSSKETLIFEFTKATTSKTIKSLLDLDRKCGFIGICPASISKSKAGEMVKLFDIIVDLTGDLDQFEVLSEANAVLSMATSTEPSFDFSPCFNSSNQDTIPLRECETLQRSYFIEKRSLIARENENSLFPSYDPSRQLSLGISLSKAFIILNRGNRISKIDVYLGILVQELNLMTRFQKSVFKNQDDECRADSTPLLFNHGLPSPCPSAKRTPAATNVTGHQQFKNIHREVIESICSQLGV